MLYIGAAFIAGEGEIAPLSDVNGEHFLSGAGCDGTCIALV